MEDNQQRPYSRDEEKEMKSLINNISCIFILDNIDPTVFLMHFRWRLKDGMPRFYNNKEELLVELGLKSLVSDSNQDLSDSSCGICSKSEEEFIFSEDDDDEDDSDDGEDDEDEADGDNYEDDDDDDGEGDADADAEADGEGDADADQKADGEGDVEYEDDDDDYDFQLISTPFCSHKFCKTCWREYLEKNFYSLEKNLTVISCPDQDCRAAVGKKTIKNLGVRDQKMYNNYLLRSYLECKQLPAPNCN